MKVMLLGFWRRVEKEWLNLAEHKADFRSRVDNIVNKTAPEELYRLPRSELALSKVDSKILGVKNVHDCLDICFTFGLIVAYYDEVI